MNIEGLNTLIDTHAQLIGQSDSLWNFFTVIALGVVGIIYGGLKLGSVGRARVLVSIGYLVWAAGNASALARTQELLVTLTASMNAAAGRPETPDVLKPFLTQVSASSVVGVLGFHAVLDVIVLAAIWWPTLVKR